MGSLSQEQMANLAPSILGFPISSGLGNASEERQLRLVLAAYDRAPDAVIESLSKVIDRENSDGRTANLFCALMC